MNRTVISIIVLSLVLGVLAACAPPAATPTAAPPPPPAVTVKATQASTPAPPLAPTRPPTQAATKPAEKPRARTAADLAALPLGAERQRILEEGARQEGELMLYALTTGLERVMEAFTKKYPFISGEVFTTRAPALIERVTAETRAGRLGGDVLEGFLANFVPLDETLLKFNSPNAQFTVMPKGATYSALLTVFTYSTRRVSPADVPTRVEDLLRPRWKGKLGLFAPPNTFPGLWVTMMYETMGESRARSFLSSLAGQDLFFYDSPQIAEKALLDGQLDIDMQGSNSARREVREGLPINWAAPEPTMGNHNFLGLFKDSKHPHAALLFIDYMLTPEVQSQINSMGPLPVTALASGEIDGVKLPQTIWLQTKERVDKIPEGTKLFEQLVMKK